VVVGSQALFYDFARWHVLELEQESLEHGLHCPHAHTNTATLCQFVLWRGHKTKVLTMRRSVHVELSTCHKVHLSPQISLSCNSIPRQLLGKCQHRTRCLSAGLFQELCMVDCSLPLLGGKWLLFLCLAYHVSLFDFERLEHVFLKTAIGHHCSEILVSVCVDFFFNLRVFIKE